MKWKLLFCLLLLMSLCVGCTGKQIAGVFEVDIIYNDDGKPKSFHALTNKNYGDIQIKGVKDANGHVGFELTAQKVDATSLAAIVAKSNADIAKSVSSGIVAGASSLIMPIK